MLEVLGNPLNSETNQENDGAQSKQTVAKSLRAVPDCCLTELYDVEDSVPLRKSTTAMRL